MSTPEHENGAVPGDLLAHPLADVFPMSTCVDTRGAAALLRLHPDTLRRLRRLGGGPEFVRVGRAVRYRVEAVEAWARTRTFKSTADEEARRAG